MSSNKLFFTLKNSSFYCHLLNRSLRRLWISIVFLNNNYCLKIASLSCQFSFLFLMGIIFDHSWGVIARKKFHNYILLFRFLSRRAFFHWIVFLQVFSMANFCIWMLFIEECGSTRKTAKFNKLFCSYDYLRSRFFNFSAW
jgi:hypothetical protein